MEKNYRVRFNEQQIDALLRVASITDNSRLGLDVIAHFGYIISKLYKIKESWKEEEDR